MRTKFFAALLACCTLTAATATASDRQIPATGLQDFQGQYDLVDGCLLNITHRGNRLMMQLENQPEAEIVAIGSAAFVTKSGRVRLEFVQYANGNVPAVRVIDTSGASQHSCQHPAPHLRTGSHLVPKTVSAPNGLPPSRIN
ncbi:3'-5' exoribonuclease [Pseudoduganella aquatica]|uniref:Lysozyme inhibitor n=1 Tax=Pseudoduganella aquatica TaxID=2660641 RepID=A0A7X4H7U3_9BURK|nr:3'-5' exoribonuclease [Pseudoduganella aquatica]MYN06303.1 hypothetical protein [Pseudoduganella aquatica]